MTNDQWYVRSLLDRETADRPERRTVLVAMELTKYNIDIASLCETRLSETGSLNDFGVLLSSRVANPREGWLEWALLSKLIEMQDY